MWLLSSFLFSAGWSSKIERDCFSRNEKSPISLWNDWVIVGVYLCVCCPPLIFAGASRRHLNLWCVSVMFIPHCLSDPTSSYAFFVDGISPEGFSCDPKSMIYIYSVDHVSHFLYFTQWDYPHRGKLSHMWKTRLWKMCVFYYYID